MNSNILNLPFTFPIANLADGACVEHSEDGEKHLVLSDGSRIKVVFVEPHLMGKNRTLINGALPLPARTLVKTRFEVSTVINGITAHFANLRYSPTSCYDVDPTLASTAMPFFTEMMALYRYYRTARSKIAVHFASTEIFPITAYICPVNFDPGASTANYQNYLSNPSSKVTMLGPLTGNGTATLEHHASTDQFAGAKWTQTQDPYSAQGTAVPNNNWFWIVGIASPTVVFSQVCYVSVVIDIEFWAFEENSPSA